MKTYYTLFTSAPTTTNRVLGRTHYDRLVFDIRFPVLEYGLFSTNLYNRHQGFVAIL